MENLSVKYFNAISEEWLNFIFENRTKGGIPIIAEKENKSFDDAYKDFLLSNTYKVIEKNSSLLWYENAEFLADEYYREK